MKYSSITNSQNLSSVRFFILLSARRNGATWWDTPHLPTHLIPWVGALAQKAIEEGIGHAMEEKCRREHRWFYMLSEIADVQKNAAEL